MCFRHFTVIKLQYIRMLLKLKQVSMFSFSKSISVSFIKEMPNKELS